MRSPLLRHSTFPFRLPQLVLPPRPAVQPSQTRYSHFRRPNFRRYSSQGRVDKEVLTAGGDSGVAEFALHGVTDIENLACFRAFPVLDSLLSLGRTGYTSLIRRNISFARSVESFLRFQPSYDVLGPLIMPSIAAGIASDPLASPSLNVVLFAPSSAAPVRFQGENEGAILLEALNDSHEIFATGTVWTGRKALRLAMSN